MKVVLFCGGLGTRLREHSEEVPKPLVNVGSRPILWHLMRYYAHFGHKDFILCLGYRGAMIREYFVNYREYLTNDFVLSGGDGGKIELLSKDIDDWRITFVDTGLHSSIGQRLVRVRQHLDGEAMFLANYADALTDLPLDAQIAEFAASDAIVSFAAVPLPSSLHGMLSNDGNIVTGFGSLRSAEFQVNGGYFCMRPEIFENIEPGDDLVEGPFARLIAQRRLRAYRHDGFWQAMDTFKDKIAYDHLEVGGNCPWKVWAR